MAHNGNVAAQYALGSKYYHGEGVKYNSEEAFKWIKKATEGGLVEAHYRLGELYERGIGVKRNFSKALKCYERAAGKGYQDAVDALILIPLFVRDFLCIHPFNDGNGRMSRLLTILLLYKCGYRVGKYISIESKMSHCRWIIFVKQIGKFWEVADFREFLTNG